MTHIFHRAATGALLGFAFIITSSDAAFAKPAQTESQASCSISDIKVLLTGTAAPVDCLGAFSGNNSNSATSTTLFGAGFTNDFTSEIKLDSSSGDQKQGWFSIANNDAKNEGTLTFLKNIDTVFSFVLKASQSYTSYIFDGVTAGQEFSFTTAGTSKNSSGIAQGLSHASLYISDKATPTPAPTTPPVTSVDSQTPVTPVTPVEPEPQTPTPVTPVTPVEPEPQTPVTPVTPVEPEPQTPVTPVTPVIPVTPVTPVTPVEPQTPVSVIPVIPESLPQNPVPPIPPVLSPIEIPEPSTVLGLLAFGTIANIARRRQAR